MAWTVITISVLRVFLRPSTWHGGIAVPRLVICEHSFGNWKNIQTKQMKDIVYAYMTFGEDYWWAFLIVWLLLIIVAWIPDFVNFRKTALIIPGIFFLVWYILEILRYLCLI